MKILVVTEIIGRSIVQFYPKFVRIFIFFGCTNESVTVAVYSPSQIDNNIIMRILFSQFKTKVT